MVRRAPRCRSRTSSSHRIPIVVKAGAEITVTNDDGTVHTLTADDKSFDTGDLDGGATGNDHGGVTGQVRVPLRHPQLHDRHDRGEMNDTELATGTIVATVAGAVALLVSGWVHFYLYFRGGYRGIAPDRVLGLTISRSFALNAIVALVIAEGLVLGLRYRALLLPAAAVGAGFAVATLVAYFLSRTRGLLGFKETADHHRGGDRDDRRGGRAGGAGAGRGHGADELDDVEHAEHVGHRLVERQCRAACRRVGVHLVAERLAAPAPAHRRPRGRRRARR